MLFLLKTSGTVAVTGSLFDVSAATPPCHTISVQSHITESQEHKSKVGMDTFFHLDMLKISCNAVHFSYHLSYSIFA